MKLFFALLFIIVCFAIQADELKIVGDCNFPPYSYIDSSGDITGFVIELIKTIMDKNNYEYSIQLTSHFDILKTLIKEKIDILLCTPYLLDTMNPIMLSSSVLTLHYGVFYFKNNRDIKNIKELNNTILVLLKENMPEEILNIRNENNKKIIIVNTPLEALLLIDSKKVDYAIMPVRLGSILINKFGLNNILYSRNIDLQFEYYFGITKNNKVLLQDINRTLINMKNSGEYETLLNKWEKDIPIKTKSKNNGLLKFLLILILGIFVLFILSFIYNYSLERMVKRKTSQLESIIANINQGIIICDEKGIIKYINHIAANILHKNINLKKRYKLNDIYITRELNKNDYTKFHRKSNDEWFNNKKYLINQNGEYILISERIKPIVINNKNIGMLILFKDIQEEFEKEQSYILNQKYYSIAQLTSKISHDFNNLLTPIIMNLDSMKDLIKDNKQANIMLKDILKAIEMVRKLNNKLFNFTLRKKTEEDIIFTKEFIESSIRFLLKNTNVKYEIDIENNVYNIRMNELDLMEVINNIIINAIETEHKDLFISIRVKNKISIETKEKENNKFVIIEIENNGPAIKKEDLNKILDLYFTTKKRGSGIGLSTSVDILRSYGGDIKISSDKNKTIFTLLVPAEIKTFNKYEEDKIDNKIRNKSILIMDDDILILRTVKRILENQGHNIDIALSGEEVIRLYEKKKYKYDFIFLDMNISKGMGAIKTNELLKNYNKKSKVILMSGSDFKHKYRELGFDAFLHKPFNISQLLDLINSLN